MTTYITVTLTLEIDDADAFAKAARATAFNTGLDADDIITTYTVDDLGACAVMLLDPGVSPDGCTIIDGSAEVSED